MLAPARRVILLGAPGVGKGTYARHVAPMLGLEHVVAGDLVRREIRARTPIGQRMAAAAKRGDLVEDSDVLGLVFGHLRENGLIEHGFMLDGVPRTLAQAREVDSIAPPDLALHLEMDEEIMLLKMVARRIGPDNGVYNLAYILRDSWYMPPLLPEPVSRDAATGEVRCAHGTVLEPNELVTCAQCTEGMVMREDDREDVCRHRLQTYKAETYPLLEHYAPIRTDFVIDGGVDACLPRLLELLRKRGCLVGAHKEPPREVEDLVAGMAAATSRL